LLQESPAKLAKGAVWVVILWVPMGEMSIHIGATCRIQFNDPNVAAMRLYVSSF